MRRTSRVVIAASLALGLALATAGDALALSSTPDTTAMVNGVVRAFASTGNTIFVGGNFTRVLASVGKGHTSYDTTDLAAIDMPSGQGIPTWTTTFALAGGTPEVDSLALSSDGTLLYVGGHFDTVNGVKRKDFAVFDIATGALDPMHPNFQNPVLTILAEPTMVYVGGAFTRVDDTPRAYLAALNPDGSLNDSWVPAADQAVRTLALSPDGTGVFVGGHFDTMDGVSRQSVAEVDASTGALDAWAIPAGVINTPQTAWSILLDEHPRLRRLRRGPELRGGLPARQR